MGFFDKLFGRTKEMSASDQEQLQGYIRELERLYKSNLYKNNHTFLEVNKEASREIGRRINASHGFSGMVYVCDSVKPFGVGANRELEFAWDSIGEWRG